jgi:hypothetical protein
MIKPSSSDCPELQVGLNNTNNATHCKKYMIGAKFIGNYLGWSNYVVKIYI